MKKGLVKLIFCVLIVHFISGCAPQIASNKNHKHDEKVDNVLVLMTGSDAIGLYFYEMQEKIKADLNSRGLTSNYYIVPLRGYGDELNLNTREEVWKNEVMRKQVEKYQPDYILFISQTNMKFVEHNTVNPDPNFNNVTSFISKTAEYDVRLYKQGEEQLIWRASLSSKLDKLEKEGRKSAQVLLTQLEQDGLI